jgi:hypothetical protein
VTLRTIAAATLTALTLAGKAHAATITQQIRANFGPAHDDTALCIANAESRLRPWAISPTGDYGLFQVHLSAHPWVDRRRILTIRYAIQVAVRLSHRGRDWQPWTGTYGRGLCHGIS